MSGFNIWRSASGSESFQERRNAPSTGEAHSGESDQGSSATYATASMTQA
jgi:hypothetical protein